MRSTPTLRSNTASVMAMARIEPSDMPSSATVRGSTVTRSVSRTMARVVSSESQRIVVRGTARVTRDNDVFELFANQSAYIPIGAKHRLENPGAEMLELIEVQSGDYLGEDDIVRYEDQYGRS